jgi:hypothetical protein
MHGHRVIFSHSSLPATIGECNTDR